MKGFILFIFFILSPTLLSGQELLGSLGGDDYSLGEAFIETHSGSGIIVSEGLHQPLISLIDIKEYSEFHINVYPNPTSDKLILEYNLTAVSIVLYDSRGSLVFQDNSGNKVFDLSSIPQGKYTLFVMQNDNLQYSCKVLIQR